MKKIFSALFALLMLGTSAWASSVTKIGNGQYRLDMTMTDIATANNWTSGTKNTFMIGDHIQFVGYGANATLYNASTGGKGARIYETQNNLGVTKIGVNGVIDTLCLTYVVGNAGVISLTNYSLGPVPADSQIVSGTKYALKKDALCFYVGRTDGTKKDGKCDITNIYAVYTIHPSAITMDETKTISVGDAFQIGQVAPIGAYQVWSSNNENAVAVDQNGMITAKAAGEATITVTSPAITKSCVITVVAKSKETTFVESLAKVGTMATWNAGVRNYDGENGGIKWAVRNFQRNSDDMIGGVQGTEMRNDGNKNYIAYQNANIEGGVKRIAFQWRATDATKPIYFDIDGTIAAETIFKNELQASADYASAQYFCREIAMAKNYQFRITIPNANSSTIVFGPMTITPYLLYTTKTAEANGKYTNTDLINNVPDTATVVYTLEGNDGEASIDAATGEVTCLAEGEVTVKATWGKVYTFYTLKTHILLIPEISFEADTLNKDIYDASFTNPLTTTPGVGDTTYTSSDTTVATIDANGQVTIVAGGTTTITASIAANATYAAKSASYILNVDLLPAEGAAWTETFSKVPAVKNYTGTDKYVGDSSVYNWAMTYYQRQTADDMVGTYLGTRIRYSGALAMDGVQEGGIKAIRFDYRAANQVNPIHFKVNVDGTDYEYNHAIIPVKGTIVTYAQKFEVKKNTQFSINMDAVHTPEQGYPIFSPITIAPYLLYTVKSMEKKQEEGSFTNTALINNAEGDVVYSVEGENADKIASINASTGEVTILGEGVVTVKATWGNVFTTYTLIAHTKTVPEISFAQDTINKDMLDAAFTNALTTTAGVGDTTYISSNKQVATVAANGEVTIVGAGQTIITANIAENATFAAASASYVLNVGFTPAVGTFWKETFSKRNPQKSKDGGDIATIGDSAVYNWALNNYDYNITDNFDGVIGVRVRYNGYIKNELMEGGVKALAFQWRPSNASNYIHYTMAVGEDTTVFDSDPLQSINYTFARKYEQKSNTSFTFTIDTAGLKNTVAFLGVGPITVVPYLLYTEKKVSIQAADYTAATYTNTALINNTDLGQVVYTLEGGSEIATINAATGEVTVVSPGTVTIQATWGEVYTTYELTITGTPTGLHSSAVHAAPYTKILRNDHVYIMRDGRLFDLQGNELK